VDAVKMQSGPTYNEPKHYVITRSYYGPEWDAEANLRRLRITQALAPMMRRQAPHTWLGLLDNRDPYLQERMAIFDQVVIWEPKEPVSTRKAAADHLPDWDYLGTPTEPTLQTRLDDDDTLASDGLARVQAAARALPHQIRTILVLPVGIRVWAGTYSEEFATTNAMQTLYTMPGDPLTVYDYGHHEARSIAPVVLVDKEPGWLYVRHRDSISGENMNPGIPIDRHIRSLFPIDWHTLESSWAS
jgi:hypothetical protein